MDWKDNDDKGKNMAFKATSTWFKNKTKKVLSEDERFDLNDEDENIALSCKASNDYVPAKSTVNID